MLLLQHVNICSENRYYLFNIYIFTYYTKPNPYLFYSYLLLTDIHVVFVCTVLVPILLYITVALEFYFVSVEVKTILTIILTYIRKKNP